MERVDTIAFNAQAWQVLGEGLAALHSVEQLQFGLDHDNFIGLNPQPNVLTDDWGGFFVDYRLRYQVSLIGSAAVRGRFAALLDAAAETLAAYLNDHCTQSSLVHGDLWSGNVLADSSGRVWLIDTAVYYGDADVDLAMSEMFGGFGEGFYSSYQQARELSPEYPHKRVIYNLYHYLNHYNLFGDTYLRGCEHGFAVIDEICGRR